VKLDSARKFALSLPETTEEPHFEEAWRLKAPARVLAAYDEARSA
jgi:hypothetical protein